MTCFPRTLSDPAPVALSDRHALYDLAARDSAHSEDELPLARKRKVIALPLDIHVDSVTRRSGRGDFDPDSAGSPRVL